MHPPAIPIFKRGLVIRLVLGNSYGAAEKARENFRRLKQNDDNIEPSAGPNTNSAHTSAKIITKPAKKISRCILLYLRTATGEFDFIYQACNVIYIVITCSYLMGAVCRSPLSKSASLCV